MSLGLCCQWIESRKNRNNKILYENIINEKSLQLGRYRDGKYDRNRIIQTYHNNVEEIIKLVPKLVDNNIKVFRLSSGILPLFEFNEELIENDSVLKQKFATLGKLFKENAIRVTCHPGQFTIINSNEDRIIENSIRELRYHAWMFDTMEFEQSPYYAINIHGGKRGNFSKLVETINNKLPQNVRSRLTLENDERCFSVKQLQEIYNETGVPIVFDSHHFAFNDDGIDTNDAFNISVQTWNSIKPLQHVSNTEPGLEEGSFTERRKHSWLIHRIPEPQLEFVKKDLIDLEVEAKGKNLALFKIRRDFDIV